MEEKGRKDKRREVNGIRNMEELRNGREKNSDDENDEDEE